MLTEREQKLISPKGRKSVITAANYIIAGSITAFILLSLDKWGFISLPIILVN